MWTKSINLEVILICILSLIPWPGPSVFKISCSRESARVVRKIVQSKWLPILDKYHVKVPLECPFHPLRDIFALQQAAKKQNRPSQWTCGLCGKSFYDEQHLDVHFDARHHTNINTAEDAICLANYCDIMRCKVLVAKDATLSFGDTIISTDIELWNEATAYRTALSMAGSKDLMKLAKQRFPTSSLRASDVDETADGDDGTDADDDDEEKLRADAKKLKGSVYSAKKSHDDRTKNKTDEEEEESDDDDDSDSNATSSSTGDGNLVDSTLPPAKKKQQRLTEFQRLKANCKSDDLERLKMKCEMLVRDCIAGLLIQLSNDDFKSMEDELNRAVCWYLTCDRYWEDGPTEQRAFPWGLVFVLIFVLSLGVCFCYYIIWILFDSDENSMTPPPSQPPMSASAAYIQSSHLSPTHHMHQHQHLNPAINYHHPHHPQHQSQSQPQHQQQQQQQQPQQHHPPLSSSATGSIDRSMNVQSNALSTGYAEEFYSAQDYNDLGQNEHYIYVTYPPELKRRLLESCYNRTTRL